MENKKTNELGMKIKFYIMSLWLLFILVFMLTVDIHVDFSREARFIGFRPLILSNILPLISLLCSGYGIYAAYKLHYEWKGVANPPHKIKRVQNENFEYLTFLTTYIIPLICIDLGNIRYIIILAVLLIMIGYIFVKMDFYLGNPTLALLGYKLYRIDVEENHIEKNVLVISKDKLRAGDSIVWIQLDDRNWFVRRASR